jgi:drug/metabolite transporter (DMT)-like permease
MSKSVFTDYVLLGVLALIWSTSFLLIKIGVTSIGPFTLTSGRLIIAGVLLGTVLLLKGQRLPLDKTAINMYFAVGILGNTLPFALISWGEVYIDSSMAAILMGIMPISTFVLAHFFIPSESMTPRKVLGITVGFAGLLTLVGFTALGHLGSNLVGQLAVLGGALCYSVTTIVVRSRPVLGGLQMATGVTLVAAVSSLPLTLLLENPAAMSPTREAVYAMIILGVFPTAVAALLYLRIIRNLGAVTFSQINFLIPVLGSIWGVLLLNEALTSQMIVALGLVLLGVGLIQPPRADKRPPQ